MKVVCFNVNGIRARLHQLAALQESHQPDVVAVQEIKVASDQFPLDEVKALGYQHVEHFGQKGHYGVALLSKQAPENVLLGVPWRDDDQQRRLIAADYPTPAGKKLRIANGYFPQGDSRAHPTKFPNKAEFYADVARLLEERFSTRDHLLVVGDMNVAPAAEDIGIGPDNEKRWLRTGKASFLPEEREWLQTLLDWGLTDTYASHCPPEKRLYSWFDYRSRGFERDPKRGLRIDLLLASAPLMKTLTDAGIDYDIRGGDKPSDHCPCWCTFDL